MDKSSEVSFEHPQAGPPGGPGPAIRGPACLALLALVCWLGLGAGEAGAQQPVKRLVLIEPVDGVYGTYRIVLEVDAGSFLAAAETAQGAPSLFLGRQPIRHTFSLSGNLLTGYLRQAPEPGDALWFAYGIPSNFDPEQGRQQFAARGLPFVAVDLPAMLKAGTQQAKTIAGVRTSTETRTGAGGHERTVYLVALEVENCTADNFAEPGPFGRPLKPTVYVGQRPGDVTYFSAADGRVVGEFSARPAEGEPIFLQYPEWRLTAPEPFTLETTP